MSERWRKRLGVEVPIGSNSARARLVLLAEQQTSLLQAMARDIVYVKARINGDS